MSADQASSAASGSVLDPVRALQHTLYRSAKADPGRRFHALRDKVYRRDVLWRAWVAVRRNGGAPGVDGTTLAEVEEYGVDRFLDELAEDLRADRWRPLPARRVLIPKPGTSEQRPLSIPSVRDRVVAAAVKIVLEPIFEAGFLSCSFGFRPKRSTHDALQVLIDESWQGKRWVVETDIANCFSAIPHEKLMQAIEERVSDQGVLKLLRAMLRAGVMQDGSVRREASGTPQGGPLSPLLCNVYLHRLDRVWDTSEHGVLVRYCDDLVVMCRSRDQAQAALERLTVLLGDLGLEPKASKTRIVHLVEGGQGVDFLGFHNRLVRGRTPRSAHLVFLGRWPARKAITTCQATDSGDHCPVPPAGAGRVDRGGTQLVPARMGGVFPLRQLRTDTRPDQELCLDPARAVAVQTGQTPPSLGLGDDPGTQLTQPPGPDQP